MLGSIVWYAVSILKFFHVRQGCDQSAVVHVVQMLMRQRATPLAGVPFVSSVVLFLASLCVCLSLTLRSRSLVVVFFL